LFRPERRLRCSGERLSRRVREVARFAFVESLQLIVVTPPEDHRFKFTLDRKEFLAGQLGLRLLGKDDPVDTSSYESVILWPHPVEPRKHDANGETMILTKYKTLREIPRSLETCVKCHDTSQSNIFGRSGPRNAYLQSDPDEPTPRSSRRRNRATQWKLYLRLRTAQGK